jgi:hypothetical protein
VTADLISEACASCHARRRGVIIRLRTRGTQVHYLLAGAGGSPAHLGAARNALDMGQYSLSASNIILLSSDPEVTKM